MSGWFAGDHSPHSAAPHRFPDLDRGQIALSFVEPGPDRRVHLQPDHLDQDLTVFEIPNRSFDDLDILVGEHSLRGVGAGQPVDSCVGRACLVSLAYFGIT